MDKVRDKVQNYLQQELAIADYNTYQG